MRFALTFRPEDRSRLRARLAQAPAALVIGLCAEWCHTCGEFLPSFERLAQARPDQVFVWLDIEDDAALVGDIDVENFPSLAVFRGDVPLFFGPTLPQEGVVARLLDALARHEAPAARVPEAVSALPAALARLTEESATSLPPAPRRR